MSNLAYLKTRTENVRFLSEGMKVPDEDYSNYYSLDEREFGKYRYTNEEKFHLFKDLLNEGWNCISYKTKMVAVVHIGVGVVKTGELTKESREVLDSF